MASKIKIRRSSTATDMTGQTLQAGELAWVDNGGAGTLYIGDAGSGAIKEIGGAAGGDWGLALLAGTALTGNTTAANIAGGAGGAFNFAAGTTTVAAPNADTDAATKKYVDDEVAGASPSMTDILDTNIQTGGDAPAGGHLLIHNGLAGANAKWVNEPMTGDVNISAAGVASIQSIPNGVVQMATDTDGNFIAAVTPVANQTAVNVTSGTGNAGDSVAVGLAAAITTPGNLTVGGDLVVNGNTTEVKTSTIELEDPVFVLGENAAQDAHDRGIQIKWNDGLGTGTSAKTGFFGMDQSDEKFKFYADATFGTNATVNQVTGGTLGKLEVAELEGTIKTPAQNDITSATSLTAVGTIATGTWNATVISPAKGGTGISTAGWQTGVVTHDATNGWQLDTNGLNPEMGGTGIASYTAGDMVFATGGTTLDKLAGGGANGGKIMMLNTAGNAPTWTDTIDGGVW